MYNVCVYKMYQYDMTNLHKLKGTIDVVAALPIT